MRNRCHICVYWYIMITTISLKYWLLLYFFDSKIFLSLIFSHNSLIHFTCSHSNGIIETIKAKLISCYLLLAINFTEISSRNFWILNVRIYFILFAMLIVENAELSESLQNRKLDFGAIDSVLSYNTSTVNVGNVLWRF